MKPCLAGITVAYSMEKVVFIFLKVEIVTRYAISMSRPLWLCRAADPHDSSLTVGHSWKASCILCWLRSLKNRGSGKLHGLAQITEWPHGVMRFRGWNNGWKAVSWSMALPEYAQRHWHLLLTIPLILKPLWKCRLQILPRLDTCSQGLPIVLSVFGFPEKRSEMICVQEANWVVSPGTTFVGDLGKPASRGRN